MSKKMKKIGSAALAATMVIPTLGTNLMTIAANDTDANDKTDGEQSVLPPVKDGYQYVSKVVSVEESKNTVTLNLEAGEKIRFTFLEGNVFRMYMAPKGHDFQEYPTANSSEHTATITDKTDDEYYTEYQISPTVVEADNVYTIKTKDITVVIDKETTMMTVTNAEGQIVIQEAAPIQYKDGSTIQTLATDENEYFFGGGTQNGRFSHKGEVISIVNSNNWVDGGVASPNPFYWSTKGYGVVRNTWKPGSYDFTSNESITTTHNEKRFDAYFFVDPTPKDILNDYYELTGAPAELPEYASYLGHLNCYNRDYWLEVDEGTSGAVKLGDKWYKESQTDNGGEKETLNGPEDYTAESIIREYKKYDMPLGWFLPNDGYGCGYGQEDTQAGNIDNLREFAENAIASGVQTGLWTQSNLWPADETNPGKDERDIYKEVEAGVHSVKTDVAWVGSGYSMALNGISVAYDAIESRSGLKPNIVTLDGWAGTQRYAGIWSGDQTGGQWEYIRFHIPTYIGTSLSGQPNIGSDMDGIFGGKNPTVWTRDFQWKAFTTYMLDMDGWGSNQKSPWALGEDGTSINRAYLKLKAQLMPYNNTISHEATAEMGLPMLRAMFLEEANAYTLGTATQYQYMWGDNFLVAPIYQNTAADSEGNDIRNDIYLPSTSNVWIDYLTGKQYRGGQVLNNFEAPIWKLPVFVKNGAIIPQYPENNNPEAITEKNPDGLDRTQRIVEFFPEGSTEFTAYEDDGKTMGGAGTTTRYTSVVEDGTATLTAEKTVGSYESMQHERSTEFIVHVSKAPEAVNGTVAGKGVEFKKVNTLEEYNEAEGNVYFYDEAPKTIVEQYASEGSTYETMEEKKTPELRVKSTELLDINDNEFQVVVKGFENKQDLGEDTLDANLTVPTNLQAGEVTDSTINFTWDAIEDAVSYDVEVDGVVFRNNKQTTYTHTGLSYLTDHAYRVRMVNAKGNYSNWSEVLNVTTADNPYRNVPAPAKLTWTGGLYGNHSVDLAFDQIFQSGDGGFHSSAGALGKELIVDYGQWYAFDKFEYYPRTDAGNGTVTEMDIYTSMDGKNWSNPINCKWVRNAETKIVDLDGVRARYIKLIPRASVGTYFAASELMFYKENGTSGHIVGDVSNSGSLDEGDLTFYQNYTGLKQSDADWNYIENVAGDIDGNGIVDAYDFSYVATQLNGGIAKPASGVEGKIMLIPSKTDIKAGDEVTVDVYGIGLKNVNAFSVEMPVTGQFTANPATATVNTTFMMNYSKNRTHSDQTTDNYTLFTNIGEQDLINGTGSIAKIKIVANEDFIWDTNATQAVLVGQDMSTADAIIDLTDTPEAPETKKFLTADEVTMSFKNETGTPSGDSLFQQSNWKALLFDGNTSGDMAEFKWDLPSSPVPEQCILPTDFIMDVSKDGKARPITNITIHGRQSSNGYVKKSKLSYVDANGETHDLGESTSKSPSWKINDDVTQIIWTPMESNGTATNAPEGEQTNRMLSLFEIAIEEDSAVKATGIAFDESSAKSVNVGGMAEVSAIVSPSNVSNPFYNITSSDDDIVSVTKIPMDDKYIFMIRGVSAGEATLTATTEDGGFTATWKVTVSEGADTTKLDEQLAKVAGLYQNLYTTESWATLQLAVDQAEAVDKMNQTAVDNAAIEIMKAIAALEFKGSNEDQPSSTNLIDQAGMSMFDESSCSAVEQEHASNAIDGDISTIWHSNYNSGYTLPQWFTIDLGDTYNLEQVDYLARQGSHNGHVTHYRIETSLDGKTFAPVVEGYFEKDGDALLDPSIAKEVKFDATEARYVRFIALEALGDTLNKYASCAEINFYGTKVGNFDELASLIETAETKREANYTTSTWAPFATALSEAKALTADSDAAAISAAIAKLTDTMNGLQRRAEQAYIDSLQVMVDKAEAMIAEDKTSAELEALVAQAKAVVADPSDTTGAEATLLAAEIAKEIANINNEVSETAALREDLQWWIDQANLLLHDDNLYSQDDIDALKAAVASAQAVLADENASADQLKTEIKTVSDRITYMVKVVSKDGLRALIEEAKKYEESNYTADSFKALQDAIAAAEVVVADDGATQQEVSKATSDLLVAIANLESVNFDASALDVEIEKAEQILANADDYISDTLVGVEEALAAAKEVRANATTQEEVDEATKTLRAVLVNVRHKADFTALNKAVNDAKKIDLDLYTASSAQDLKAAMANAEIILNDEHSTQEAVNAAVSSVQKAMDQLVLKSNEPAEPGDDGKGDNDDAGKEQNGSAANGNNSGNGNASNNGGSNSGSNVPATGEASQKTAFGILSILSLGGIAAIFKKKKDEEKVSE